MKPFTKAKDPHEFLSLLDSLKKRASVAKSDQTSVPFLLIDNKIFDEMMDYIRESNRALLFLTKRPTEFLISHGEAQKVLGVSENTLRGLRNRGLIDYIQYERKIWFWWKDIEIFLNRNRKEAFAI